ncbi:MAG: hypothetical protein V3V41_10140 [Candidatus Heimdallarchaeota archaeon]
MSLGTLGAVIKFILKLETEAVGFYEKAAERIEDIQMKNIIETIIRQSKKNIKKLQRVRRENTTEMILEPIKDLTSNQYDQITITPKDWTDEEIIEYAQKIEENIRVFFKNASEKVDFLGEVAYSFEQLALRHEENLNNLIKEK